MRKESLSLGTHNRNSQNLKAKRKKTIKKIQLIIQGLWDNYKRSNIHVMEIPEGEERNKRTEAIFEAIMTDNFLQNNVRHKITNPGSSENIKQDKCPAKPHLGISFSNYRRSRIKKNLERIQRKTTPYL